jgi:uncharacterized protein (DUF1499 family)
MIAWLRPLALLLAIAALVMLTLSGPGVRFEMWSYRIGLQVFRWTAYVAIAAALAAALSLAIPKVRAHGWVLPMVALLLGLAVLYVPLRFLQQARAVPPINDITTDMLNPPRYMTTQRPYPGAEFARQQRAGYPDLAPVILLVPPRAAFSKAVSAAEAMGWEVVGRDEAAGTIEAVDTTKWFGFKDDIAVRVSSTPEGGSRIDIRSKSRVGRSDLGTNARRIRAYAERLK